jgi:hypothetical protein
MIRKLTGVPYLYISKAFRQNIGFIEKVQQKKCIMPENTFLSNYVYKRDRAFYGVEKVDTSDCFNRIILSAILVAS